MPVTDARPPRSRGETIFLGAVVGFTLLVSTGFAVATVVGGFGFPGVFIGFLLAFGAGTAVYAFLGATGVDTFEIKGVKLAGAAAAIPAIFWVISGPLDRSMKDVRAIQLGKSAEARIDAEVNRANEARRLQREAQQRASDLEAQSGDTDATSITALLARVKDSTAEDRLGKGVLELYRQGKGPFDRTIQTLTLSARFNHAVTEGTFRFCHDKRSELADKSVRFELIDRVAETSEVITLRPGSDIGTGLCQAVGYEIVLGCDAVRELLKTNATGCDSRNGVAWVQPDANRIYELTATTLNPELTPPGF